jgi:hypothetical protein
MEVDRNECRLINGDDLNVDDQSFGEGCQPDGITVYDGRLDREIFPTVTHGRVTNPNQNWNSIANRLRAFHTFLEYCRQYGREMKRIKQETILMRSVHSFIGRMTNML